MGTNRHRTASVTSAQQRQPKGIKDGGQFAGSSNPESNVQLVDVDMDGVTETQRLARNFIRRYGLHDHTVNGYMDSDDLTQDAVMAYLVASQTDRPEGVELPVGVIAKRSIIRALDSGSYRGKGDHSAMKLLDQSRVKREAELDRPLTSTEFDELAQALRMSLPASHRPGAGFHRPNASITKFDSMPEGQVDEIMFRASSDEASTITDDFSEGTFGDRAMQLKSDGNQVAASPSAPVRRCAPPCPLASVRPSAPGRALRRPVDRRRVLSRTSRPAPPLTNSSHHSDRSTTTSVVQCARR